MATIRDAIQQGTQVLTREELADARLDATVLLSHVLDLDRSLLYAYPERELTTEQEERFRELIVRRHQGEPVAYLLGHKEFYGLDLLVDQRVLIPRPETELLVEVALKVIRERLARKDEPVVADIGTGSGAIPIAIAVEEPRLPYLYGCDISPAALELALLNCQRHGVAERVRLLQGDLLQPLTESIDILLANLPYVGTEEIEIMTPDVLNYEPHLALFSGPSGLDLLRRFCREAAQPGTLKAEAIIVLEIGYQQRESVTQIIKSIWPQAVVLSHKDYGGWDRILEIVLKKV